VARARYRWPSRADDDWRLTSLQQGVSIPEATFEMPGNVPHVVAPCLGLASCRAKA